MNLTKQALIDAAKNGKPLWVGTHIPALTYKFYDFSQAAGIATAADLETRDEFDVWKTWSRSRDYAAKKAIFTKLGFDVLALFADDSKAMSAVDDYDVPFLAQKLNVFVVAVQTWNGYGEEAIYFILSYTENVGEIAQATVDYKTVANEQVSHRTFAKMFNHPYRKDAVDDFLAAHHITANCH